MILQLKKGVEEEGLEKVIKSLEEKGIERERLDISYGDICLIGVKGDTSRVNEHAFEGLEGVAEVRRITVKWKELTREYHPEDTVIDVSGVKIGKGLVIMAGPCAIESYEQALESAKIAKDAGAQIIRGGAYKPRTSRMDFQGLEEEGLKILADIKKKLKMPVVTEIMDKEDIPLFEKYGIDIYQVGARDCQNFRLLKALAHVDKPVMIKRGNGVSVDEFLNAADYVYSGDGKGNSKVILCERGDKTVDPNYRNVMNINNIPYLRNVSHLPVIADPSHSTGKREFVIPIALAAIAAGAQGLIVEVHYNPGKALCDGAQSLDAAGAMKLVKQVKKLYQTLETFK